MEGAAMILGALVFTRAQTPLGRPPLGSLGGDPIAYPNQVLTRATKYQIPHAQKGAALRREVSTLRTVNLIQFENAHL